MKRHHRKSAILTTLGVICELVLTLHVGTGAVAAQQNQPTPVGMYRGVSTAVQFDISLPLDEITPPEVVAGINFETQDHFDPLTTPLNPAATDDAPIVQSSVGLLAMPAPGVNFNGPSNLANVSPPSPSGDVGLNHYVVMSNLYFAVYSKTGTLLYGLAANNTLWAGFGGNCQTDNAGSPIVLYDQLADRWILTQHVERQIIEHCLKLMERLECRDYTRFDWRLNAAGEPKLLEVNPNPGWCWDGHLAKMAHLAGLSYPDMLAAILHATEERVGLV